MNKYTRGLVFSSLCLLAGNAIAADKPVAVVNGKPISQKIYDHYLAQATKQRKDKKGAGDIPREAIINELVNRELLYQNAIKDEIEKIPEVAFQIEQLRINTLIQGMLTKVATSKPITDADLKKEYDARIGQANLSEYKAGHILLKTEEEAKTVIAELDSGSKFAELAKKKSTGPSGKDGGDLGWFNAGQMVPPFSQAVAQMKKGSYSKTPVKTQFGWHVIKLEDTRKPEPPRFDDVKKQLQIVVQNQRLQEYIENMRKSAKIEIK
ncbi:MAG: peptidylprolyl isomerase [Gammaproteobacteria bacterium]|nr:peptidylprolyl isomerase [Gammaproteobacteria bacterium]